MDKKPIRVLVTGAAGKAACSLVPSIAAGDMLGLDQPVILHIFDSPSNANGLNDVKMELMYSRLPLLEGVIATTDVVEACTDVTVVVMVGGFPRKVGVEMDVISKHVPIYKSLASALENHAAVNCKVLVVVDPADRIALILKKFAPSIHEKNITCLSRLYHNRAVGQIALRLKVPGCDVKNVIIWGSDSLTYYHDVNHATVNTPSGEKSVRELINNDAWFDGEFVTRVERLGDTHHISAYATGWAACDQVRDWILGTPNGSCVSMGVCSDGSYDVPPGLFYSFPVTCANGEWTIVQGLPIDEVSRKKMRFDSKELSSEVAFACLSLS